MSKLFSMSPEEIVNSMNKEIEDEEKNSVFGNMSADDIVIEMNKRMDDEKLAKEGNPFIPTPEEQAENEEMKRRKAEYEQKQAIAYWNKEHPYSGYVWGRDEVKADDIKETGMSLNPDDFNTKLDEPEEAAFQSWRANLPEEQQRDSDFDFRGFFKHINTNPGAKEEMENNPRFLDKFKKPNHPTFTKDSMYAKQIGDNNYALLAGAWDSQGLYRDSGFVQGKRQVKHLPTYTKEDIEKVIKEGEEKAHSIGEYLNGVHASASLVVYNALKPWESIGAGVMRTIGGAATLAGKAGGWEGLENFGKGAASVGDFLDKTFEIATMAKDDENYEHRAPVKVAAWANSVANTVATWRCGASKLTHAGNIVLQSTSAGANSFYNMYDAAKEAGASDEKAAKAASAAMAVDTTLTALLGAAPLGKMISKSKAFSAAGKGFAKAILEPKSAADLERRVQNFAIKSFLLNTGVGSLEAGGVMGMQSAADKIITDWAQGEQINFVEAAKTAGHSAVEGVGVGLLFGGMSYKDFRRNVRECTRARIRSGLMTSEGCDAHIAVFHDGVASMIEKLGRGEKLTREDLCRAGIPADSPAASEMYVNNLLSRVKDKMDTSRTENARDFRDRVNRPEITSGDAPVSDNPGDFRPSTGYEDGMQKMRNEIVSLGGSPVEYNPPRADDGAVKFVPMMLNNPDGSQTQVEVAYDENTNVGISKRNGAFMVHGPSGEDVPAVDLDTARCIANWMIAETQVANIKFQQKCGAIDQFHNAHPDRNVITVDDIGDVSEMAANAKEGSPFYGLVVPSDNTGVVVLPDGQIVVAFDSFSSAEQMTSALDKAALNVKNYQMVDGRVIALNEKYPSVRFVNADGNDIPPTAPFVGTPAQKAAYEEILKTAGGSKMMGPIPDPTFDEQGNMHISISVDGKAHELTFDKDAHPIDNPEGGIPSDAPATNEPAAPIEEQPAKPIEAPDANRPAEVPADSHEMGNSNANPETPLAAVEPPPPPKPANERRIPEDIRAKLVKAYGGENNINDERWLGLNELPVGTVVKIDEYEGRGRSYVKLNEVSSETGEPLWRQVDATAAVKGAGGRRSPQSLLAHNGEFKVVENPSAPEAPQKPVESAEPKAADSSSAPKEEPVKVESAEPKAADSSSAPKEEPVKVESAEPKAADSSSAPSSAKSMAETITKKAKEEASAPKQKPPTEADIDREADEVRNAHNLVIIRDANTDKPVTLDEGQALAAYDYLNRFGEFGSKPFEALAKKSPDSLKELSKYLRAKGRGDLADRIDAGLSKFAKPKETPFSYELPKSGEHTNGINKLRRRLAMFTPEGKLYSKRPSPEDIDNLIKGVLAEPTLEKMEEARSRLGKSLDDDMTEDLEWHWKKAHPGWESKIDDSPIDYDQIGSETKLNVLLNKRRIPEDARQPMKDEFFKRNEMQRNSVAATLEQKVDNTDDINKIKALKGLAQHYLDICPKGEARDKLQNLVTRLTNDEEGLSPMSWALDQSPDGGFDSSGALEYYYSSGRNGVNAPIPVDPDYPIKKGDPVHILKNSLDDNLNAYLAGMDFRWGWDNERKKWYIYSAAQLRSNRDKLSRGPIEARRDTIAKNLRNEGLMEFLFGPKFHYVMGHKGAVNFAEDEVAAIENNSGDFLGAAEAQSRGLGLDGSEFFNRLLAEREKFLEWQGKRLRRRAEMRELAKLDGVDKEIRQAQIEYDDAKADLQCPLEILEEYKDNLRRLEDARDFYTLTADAELAKVTDEYLNSSWTDDGYHVRMPDGTLYECMNTDKDGFTMVRDVKTGETFSIPPEDFFERKETKNELQVENDTRNAPQGAAENAGGAKPVPAPVRDAPGNRGRPETPGRRKSDAERKSYAELRRDYNELFRTGTKDPAIIKRRLDAIHNGVPFSVIDIKDLTSGDDMVSWPAEGLLIRDTTDMAKAFQMVYRPDAEVAKVMFLDKDGVIRDKKIFAVGSGFSSDSGSVGDLVKMIPEWCKKVVFGHNHPTHKVEPSAGDRESMSALQKAIGEARPGVEIEGIITDTDRFYSFSEGKVTEAEIVADGGRNVVPYEDRVDGIESVNGGLKEKNGDLKVTESTVNLAKMMSKHNSEDTWVIGINSNGKISNFAALPASGKPEDIRHMFDGMKGARVFAIATGTRPFDRKAFLDCLDGSTGKHGKILYLSELGEKNVNGLFKNQTPIRDAFLNPVAKSPAVGGTPLDRFNALADNSALSFVRRDGFVYVNGPSTVTYGLRGELHKMGFVRENYPDGKFKAWKAPVEIIPEKSRILSLASEDKEVEIGPAIAVKPEAKKAAVQSEAQNATARQQAFAANNSLAAMKAKLAEMRKKKVVFNEDINLDKKEEAAPVPEQVKSVSDSIVKKMGTGDAKGLHEARKALAKWASAAVSDGSPLPSAGQIGEMVNSHNGSLDAKTMGQILIRTTNAVRRARGVEFHPDYKYGVGGTDLLWNMAGDEVKFNEDIVLDNGVDKSFYEMGADMAYMFFINGGRGFVDFYQFMEENFADPEYRKFYGAWYEQGGFEFRNEKEVNNARDVDRMFRKMAGYPPRQEDKLGARVPIIVGEEFMPEPQKMWVDETSFGPKGLDQHQIKGVNLIRDRIELPGGNFLLADNSGVGKTRQIIATAVSYMRDHPGARVAIFTQSKGIIRDSFTSDCLAMGVNLDSLNIGTYTALGDFRPERHHFITGGGRSNPIQSGYDLVILDEAHNICNPNTQRNRAYNALNVAHSVFVTATPLDRPMDAEYFLAAITNRDKADVAKQMGYILNRWTDMQGHYHEDRTPLQNVDNISVQRSLINLRNQAIAEGGMVRRSYPILGEVARHFVECSRSLLQNEVNLREVHGDRVLTAKRNKHSATFLGEDGKSVTVLAKNVTPEQFAIYKNLELKGIHDAYYAALDKMSENDKAMHVAQMISDLVDSGSDHKFIVMCSQVNDQRINTKEPGTKIPTVLSGYKKKMYRWISKDGKRKSREVYTIPASTDVLVEALTHFGLGDKLVVFNGNNNNTKEGQNAVGNFQNNSDVRIFITTPDSGGTGLNLGDAIGNAPRTMFMLTPDYSAKRMIQAIHRIFRKTTMSKGSVKFVHNESLADAHRDLVSGMKMNNLQAMVGSLDIDMCVEDNVGMANDSGLRMDKMNGVYYNLLDENERYALDLLKMKNGNLEEAIEYLGEDEWQKPIRDILLDKNNKFEFNDDLTLSEDINLDEKTSWNEDINLDDYDESSSTAEALSIEREEGEKYGKMMEDRVDKAMPEKDEGVKLSTKKVSNEDFDALVLEEPEERSTLSPIKEIEAKVCLARRIPADLRGHSIRVISKSSEIRRLSEKVKETGDLISSLEKKRWEANHIETGEEGSRDRLIDEIFEMRKAITEEERRFSEIGNLVARDKEAPKFKEKIAALKDGIIGRRKMLGDPRFGWMAEIAELRATNADLQDKIDQASRKASDMGLSPADRASAKDSVTALTQTKKGYDKELGELWKRVIADKTLEKSPRPQHSSFYYDDAIESASARRAKYMEDLERIKDDLRRFVCDNAEAHGRYLSFLRGEIGDPAPYVPSLKMLPENDLVRKYMDICQKGESGQEYFAEIYNRFNKSFIVPIVARRVNPRINESAFNETCHRAWLNILSTLGRFPELEKKTSRFDPDYGSQFSHWLSRIAMRTAISEVRSEISEKLKLTSIDAFYSGENYDGESSTREPEQLVDLSREMALIEADAAEALVARRKAWNKFNAGINLLDNTRSREGKPTERLAMAAVAMAKTRRAAAQMLGDPNAEIKIGNTVLKSKGETYQISEQAIGKTVDKNVEALLWFMHDPGNPQAIMNLNPKRLSDIVDTRPTWIPDIDEMAAMSGMTKNLAEVAWLYRHGEYEGDVFEGIARDMQGRYSKGIALNAGSAQKLVQAAKTALAKNGIRLERTALERLSDLELKAYNIMKSGVMDHQGIAERLGKKVNQIGSIVSQIMQKLTPEDEIREFAFDESASPTEWSSLTPEEIRIKTAKAEEAAKKRAAERRRKKDEKSGQLDLFGGDDTLQWNEDINLDPPEEQQFLSGELAPTDHGDIFFSNVADIDRARVARGMPIAWKGSPKDVDVWSAELANALADPDGVRRTVERAIHIPEGVPLPPGDYNVLAVELLKAEQKRDSLHEQLDTARRNGDFTLEGELKRKYETANNDWIILGDAIHKVRSAWGQAGRQMQNGINLDYSLAVLEHKARKVWGDRPLPEDFNMFLDEFRKRLGPIQQKIVTENEKLILEGVDALVNYQLKTEANEFAVRVLNPRTAQSIERAYAIARTIISKHASDNGGILYGLPQGRKWMRALMAYHFLHDDVLSEKNEVSTEKMLALLADDLKELGIPAATDYQIRQEITRMGSRTLLPKDEISRDVRIISNVMLHEQHKAFIMNNDSMYPQTGTERVEQTDLEREVARDVRKLVRDRGLDLKDIEGCCASALKTMKRRKLNRIADLRRAIEDHKKIVKSKPIEYEKDDELRRYEEELREVEKEYNEAFPKTDDEKYIEQVVHVLAVQKSVLKRKQEALERAKNGDFSKPKKNEIHDFEVEANRAAIKNITQEIKDLKTAAFPEGLPEEIAARQAQRLRALAKRNAELKSRLLAASRATTFEEERRALYGPDGKAIPRTSPEEIAAKLEQQELLGELHARMQDLEDRKYWWTKPAKALSLLINSIPRALRAGFDLSMVGMQGGLMAVRHPKIAWDAFKQTIEAMKSQEVSDRIRMGLESDFYFQDFKKMGGRTYDDITASKLPDEFKHNHDSVTIMGKNFSAKSIPGVSMSERVFSTFLNLMNVGVYKSILEAPCWGPGGAKEVERRYIAKMVSTFTGSHKTQGRTNPVWTLLFFAPKLVMNSAKIAVGYPMWKPFFERSKPGETPMTFKERSRLSKIAFKEMIPSLVGIFAMQALAQFAFGEGTDDSRMGDFFNPRSKDFLTFTRGNLHINMGRLYSQYIVMATQLMSMLFTNNNSYRRGIPSKLDFNTFAGKSGRSKTSPAAGLIADMMSGGDYLGNKFDWGKLSPKKTNEKVISPYLHAAESLVVPLSIGDIVDVARKDGVGLAAILAPLIMLGVSIQDHDDEYGRKVETPEYWLKKRCSLVKEVTSHDKKLSEKERQAKQDEIKQIAEDHPNALKIAAQLQKLREKNESLKKKTKDAPDEVKSETESNFRKALIIRSDEIRKSIK